jgi:polyphosphate kinase 2
MSKKHDDDNDDNGDHDYKRALRALQIELVKLQRRLIAENARVLVIVEGRDAAGKDGAIKRLTEHMSPRETRVHAPGKPSDREESEWYFQRFIPFLPAGGEFVVFNRSWYNRAGVERVMGYCSEEQVERFFEAICPFESLLMSDGVALRKYYLDISRKEQKQPVDEAAQENWKAYSRARDAMFERSSHKGASWRVVAADVKKTARLELMRDLLDSFSYKGKDKKLTRRDRSIVFEWSRKTAGLVAA